MTYFTNQPKAIQEAVLEVQGKWQKWIGKNYSEPGTTAYVEYEFREGKRRDNLDADFEVSYYVQDGGTVLFNRNFLIRGSWVAETRHRGIARTARLIRRSFKIATTSDDIEDQVLRGE